MEIDGSNGTTSKGWYMHDSASNCNALKLKLKAAVRKAKTAAGEKDVALLAVFNAGAAGGTIAADAELGVSAALARTAARSQRCY